MINNSALSSSMNVADLIPKAAPTAARSRADGAFGEALAGAHTVQDRRESLESVARSRRDQVQGDRTSDRSTTTARPTDRTTRPDEFAHKDAAGKVRSGADRAAKAAASNEAGTAGSSATSTTDAAEATTPVTDAADTAEAAVAAEGAAATLAVAAAPVSATTTAAITVPTTTSAQAMTGAVDAAIQMAITGTGQPATDAADAATTATITTQVVFADATVDVDPQLAAATARGAEDAVDGDVEAGPMRPITSMPTTTSGPSPMQLAAATFAGAEQVEAAATDAQTVKLTAPAAAVSTDVATGDAPAATAQLVQGAAVDAAGEPDTGTPVAAADAMPVSTKAAKDAGAVVTAVVDQADVVDADVPEAVQAGKLNGQQAPTVAAAAQHQAAVQAKAAEQAASQEGGDAAAPVKLEPATLQATTAAGSGDQVSSGIRVREGLLGAHQQQRIDHIAEQLSTRLRMSQAAGGTEVKLNLKPHELGEVSVKMNVREGVVAATVLVDKADTLRTMQANIDELKRSLESQGLTIQEFSVDVRGDAGAGGANARAQAELNRSAARTTGGSSSSVAGAAAVIPGLSGDRVVEADEVHDGDVSVLA